MTTMLTNIFIIFTFISQQKSHIQPESMKINDLTCINKAFNSF